VRVQRKASGNQYLVH
jgi:hypothetical protein